MGLDDEEEEEEEKQILGFTSVAGDYVPEQDYEIEQEE